MKPFSKFLKVITDVFGGLFLLFLTLLVITGCVWATTTIFEMLGV